MTSGKLPGEVVQLCQRNPDNGITLIEVLVVLAVIGVATGATMLGLNSADRNTRSEAEAIRLARNLALGVDEALLSGAPLALMWDAGGYKFIAWSAGENKWTASDVASLAERHDLRAPVTMVMQGANIPLPVIIASSGIGSTVNFEFASAPSDKSQDWLVSFDGFAATANPSPNP